MSPEALVPYHFFYHYLSGLKTIAIQTKNIQIYSRGATEAAQMRQNGIREAEQRRLQYCNPDSATASALAFRATTLYTRLSLNEG